MNLKETALWHVAKATEFQDKITAYEKAAEAEVSLEIIGRAQSEIGRTTPIQYYVADRLNKDFWYKALVQKRNGHNTAAQVYGIAALVEALPDQDGPRLKVEPR